jgi:heme-degrading monooxygenase HmoA
MLARVVTIQGKPEKIDDEVRHFREKVIPIAKSSQGFKNAYLMVDHKTGKMLSVVMWETEKDVQTTMERAKEISEERAKVAGASQKPMIEVYEVTTVETPMGMGMK